MIAALSFSVPAQGGDISASCAVVMDADTLQTLYSKNIDEQRPVASTTKIMTSLLACESGRLSQTVDITWEMVNTEGSLLGLRVGDRISLYDLVAGMLLPSGNDAANAAALFLAGSFSDFAAMMNERARSLGMNGSYFTTPSGLDEGGNRSTARDLALLTAHALKNSDFAQLFARSSYDVEINGEKLRVYNHNRLLSEMDGCIGGKTGYTQKAGRCLVSAVRRGSNTLVCVTLGAPDDWNDHKKLYPACFDKYCDFLIDEQLAVPAVGGTENSVAAICRASVRVLSKNRVTYELYLLPFVYCPVRRGQVIGRVVVKYDEKELLTADITAAGDVEYYAGTE